MAKATTAQTREDSDDREFASSFEEHIRAGYQCLYIPTSEESRLTAEITRVAKQLQYGVIYWDIIQGFTGNDALEKDPKFKRNPLAPLEWLLDDKKQSEFNGSHVFIFRDLDDFTQDPSVRRALRTLVGENKLSNKRFKRPMVIVSPKLNIHEKLKSTISVLDFSLPDETKLTRTFEFVRSSIESKSPDKAKCSDELRDEIVACLLGLSTTEAENALSRCLVQHGGFSRDILVTIKDEKAAIIKKSEVLTYIPEDGMASREDIGGFDLLLTWLDRRRLAYERQARNMQIDYPKGIVLLGVPGTGKSYVAKAIAKLMGLPGYIMDVGAVFGHLVGESEQRMRDALGQIEAQKGCVLLVDEADKAFGGAADAQGDSGVTRRVFGKFLTWLSEKQDRTFVIMTMNRTRGIPPEFLRAGRFDAVFYTDLPTESERKQILDIHFRKRGVDPKGLGLAPNDWTEIIRKTQGFVGSEMEEVVREARYRAYENRRDGKPTFDELYEAASTITPMSTRDKENVDEIRDYCKERAKPVSSPPDRTKAAERTRGVSVDN
jgi:SpoVK/Ycf46/Vps4 family AAA+-type ATPase